MRKRVRKGKRKKLVERETKKLEGVTRRISFSPQISEIEGVIGSFMLRNSPTNSSLFQL